MHPGKREGRYSIKGVPSQEISGKTRKIKKNPGKILDPEIAEAELTFGYLPYTSIVLSHKSLFPSNDNMEFYDIFRVINK